MVEVPEELVTLLGSAEATAAKRRWSGTSTRLGGSPAAHYSMGILSAPATAEALTGLILRGRSPLPIEAFEPGRFAGVPSG